MSVARRAVRTSGLVLAGQIVSRGASAGVFFVMARLLGQGELGRFSFVMAYISLFQVLGDLGVQQIVVREVARGRPDRARLVFNAVCTRLTLSTLSCTALWLMLPYVHNGPLPPDLRAMVLAGCVWIFANALTPMGSYFRASLSMNLPVITNVIGNLSYFALALAGMLLVGRAWAVWLALVISSVGPAVFISIAGARRLKPDPSPSLAVIRGLLGSSWPLAMNSLLMVIYTRIDQVMIGYFMGPKPLGAYAAAVKLMEGWNMIPLAVMTSVFPLLSRYAGEPGDRHRDVMRRTLRVLVIVIAAALPFVWRYGRWALELIYGPGFGEAHRALSILIGAELFLYVLYVFRDAFVSEHKERMVLIFAATTMTANVLLNLLLIPRYGIDGSAWATLLALAGVLVLAYALPPARAYGELAVRAMVRPAVAAALTGLVLWHWAERPVLSAIAGGAVYVASLLALGSFDPRDWELVREVVRRRA